MKRIYEWFEDEPIAEYPKHCASIGYSVLVPHGKSVRVLCAKHQCENDTEIRCRDQLGFAIEKSPKSYYNYNKLLFLKESDAQRFCQELGFENPVIRPVTKYQDLIRIDNNLVTPVYMPTAAILYLRNGDLPETIYNALRGNSQEHCIYGDALQDKIDLTLFKRNRSHVDDYTLLLFIKNNQDKLIDAFNSLSETEFQTRAGVVKYRLVMSRGSQYMMGDNSPISLSESSEAFFHFYLVPDIMFNATEQNSSLAKIFIPDDNTASTAAILSRVPSQIKYNLKNIMNSNLFFGWPFLTTPPLPGEGQRYYETKLYIFDVKFNNFHVGLNPIPLSNICKQLNNNLSEQAFVNAFKSEIVKVNEAIRTLLKEEAMAVLALKRLENNQQSLGEVMELSYEDFQKM